MKLFLQFNLENVSEILFEKMSNVNVKSSGERYCERIAKTLAGHKELAHTRGLVSTGATGGVSQSWGPFCAKAIHLSTVQVWPHSTICSRQEPPAAITLIRFVFIMH